MKFNRVKIARFQEQKCTLTLKEAITEFYNINSHRFSIPEPDTQWTELLIHHDVSHVIFGVNTNVLDEAAGDYWTLFATDLSFEDYLAYAKSPEGKKLIKQIGIVNIIKSLILGLPLLFRIIVRSRKMHSKWKNKEFEQYLDTPLREIRSKLNLQILEYEDNHTK